MTITQRKRYHYTKNRRGNIPVTHAKPRFAVDPEQLLGYVNGIPAKQDEERFARALGNRQFQFRINPTNVPVGMPGWLELDFLVSSLFGYRAFEIDDMSFVHRGQRKSAEMVIKDLRRKRGLGERGVYIQKVEHIDAALLLNQDDANATVRRLFS